MANLDGCFVYVFKGCIFAHETILSRMSFKKDTPIVYYNLSNQYGLILLVPGLSEK